jgi:hypothetical protein
LQRCPRRSSPPCSAPPWRSSSAACATELADVAASARAPRAGSLHGGFHGEDHTLFFAWSFCLMFYVYLAPLFSRFCC